MPRVALLLALLTAVLPSFTQTTRPSVYIEPQNGFETYVAAAIAKKQVPIDVVTDPRRAIFKLRAAPVEIKQESTGGKIARCLFAYCAGIEDKGNVSVQLIEAHSSKMVWAYSVNKQRGGSKNQQSMAEAVAKHFKEFLSTNPGPYQAPDPDEAQVQAPAPPPAPVAPVAAPAPNPFTPVARQEQDNAHLEPATQVQGQPIQAGESLGDAARRTKQHKACLELAKDNPSIVCK